MLKAFYYLVLSMLVPFILADENTVEPPPAKNIISSFSANYNLFHESDPVGHAVRQLQQLDDRTLKYSYKTDASWLIFSDKREEYTIVNIDQKKILPSHYSFRRQGTGKKRNYEWHYDHLNKTAVDIKNVTELKMDFPEGFQDKLSYHLQLRIDLINNPQVKEISFPVIDTAGRFKDYVYQYDSEDELTLPYGTIKAIKLKREVADKKRITYVWFAPELNYMLVKLTQHKKGKQEFDIQLASIDAAEF